MQCWSQKWFRILLLFICFRSNIKTILIFFGYSRDSSRLCIWVPRIDRAAEGNRRCESGTTQRDRELQTSLPSHLGTDVIYPLVASLSCPNPMIPVVKAPAPLRMPLMDLEDNLTGVHNCPPTMLLFICYSLTIKHKRMTDTNAHAFMHPPTHPPTHTHINASKPKHTHQFN